MHQPWITLTDYTFRQRPKFKSEAKAVFALEKPPLLLLWFDDLGLISMLHLAALASFTAQYGLFLDVPRRGMLPLQPRDFFLTSFYAFFMSLWIKPGLHGWFYASQLDHLPGRPMVERIWSLGSPTPIRTFISQDHQPDGMDFFSLGLFLHKLRTFICLSSLPLGRWRHSRFYIFQPVIFREASTSYRPFALSAATGVLYEIYVYVTRISLSVTRVEAFHSTRIYFLGKQSGLDNWTGINDMWKTHNDLGILREWWETETQDKRPESSTLI